jgi:hypothetical protein
MSGTKQTNNNWSLTDNPISNWLANSLGYGTNNVQMNNQLTNLDYAQMVTGTNNVGGGETAFQYNNVIDPTSGQMTAAVKGGDFTLDGQAPQSKMGAAQWANLGLGTFEAITGYLGQKKQLGILDRQVGVQEQTLANNLQTQQDIKANSLKNQAASDASFLANQPQQRQV